MPQIRKIPHSFPDKLKKIKIKKKTGSRKNTQHSLLSNQETVTTDVSHDQKRVKKKKKECSGG